MQFPRTYNHFLFTQFLHDRNTDHISKVSTGIIPFSITLVRKSKLFVYKFIDLSGITYPENRIELKFGE